MTEIPFPAELLEVIDEFLSDVSREVEIEYEDAVEAASWDREKIKAFLENFFIQFYENTLGISPGSIAILHSKLARYSSEPPKDFSLDMLKVVKASKRILFHWHELIADDYVVSLDQFKHLLVEYIPELFRSLATYLQEAGHKELAQRVAELLNKWKGVLNE